MKHLLLLKLFGAVPVWAVSLLLVGASAVVIVPRAIQSSTASQQSGGPLDDTFAEATGIDEIMTNNNSGSSSHEQKPNDTNSPTESTSSGEQNATNDITRSIFLQSSDNQQNASYDSQEPTSNTSPGNTSGSDSGVGGTNNNSSSNGTADSSDGGSGDTSGDSQDPPEVDPPTNSAPTAPSNATATIVQHNLVTIRANQASDSDGTIAYYQLLREGVVIATKTTSSNPFTMSDNSPTVGETYSYVVRAVDDDSAVGPNSNSVSVTIPPQDVTAPSLPTNFRITDNKPGSITLAWNPSIDDQTPQEEIWYIITSPLDESYFYTWTTINPYQTYWFDEPGRYHEVYIQAIDLAGNTTSKAGPVSFTAQ